MKWTRMVNVVAIAAAQLALNAGHAHAGDLLDRLFRRRNRESVSEPAAPSRSDAVRAASLEIPTQTNALRSPTPLALDSLTLDEALRIAEARQPELAAAAAAIDAARGRYRQARTYPNPSLDVRGEQLGPTNIVAGVSQPVILGGRRERAMEASCRDIETREREFEALRARVFRDVKQAFYEVVGLQQLLTLAHEQERTAQSLVEKMQERFKQGDVAERDVLRVEVDLSTVRIQAENLERSLTETRKTLATRMGISSTTIAQSEGELSLPERFASEEELTAKLLAGHPELQAALAEVRFREAVTAHAHAERIPDATITVLYRRLTETNQDTADVGILLPLPLFDRREGRIQETAAEASRAHAQRAATENELLGQLRRAYESLLTYYRQTDTYQKTILPKTDRSLELIRTAYEGGEVSILELLDSQRQSNTAHAAYLDVLSKLVQKWLDVEYLVQSQPAQSALAP